MDWCVGQSDRGAGAHRRPASGSLDTGLAKVSQNPVNLRGSLKQLPQEGSGESTQAGSTSAADEFGTPLAGTVGAQPECTSHVGGARTGLARGQPGQLVYGSRAARGACPGRLRRGLGGSVQPGRPGGGGTSGRWA